MWTSRPVLLSAAILAATTTAAVALPGGQTTDRVTLPLSDTAVAQSAELTATSAEDTARLAAERAQMSASRGTLRAKIEAQTKAKAEAEAKAARAKAEREAQERAAREAAERKAAALTLENAQEDPQLAAQHLMPEFGFTSDRQWQCLQTLWTGESDWRWWVENPSSGAYGIPQSLPAEKMASMGADWRTNPVTQIRWGLDYIKASYGTPCNALEFWQSQNPHWY